MRCGTLTHRMIGNHNSEVSISIGTYIPAVAEKRIRFYICCQEKAGQHLHKPSAADTVNPPTGCGLLEVGVSASNGSAKARTVESQLSIPLLEHTRTQHFATESPCSLLSQIVLHEATFFSRYLISSHTFFCRDDRLHLSAGPSDRVFRSDPKYAPSGSPGRPRAARLKGPGL
jgi:hypothetical protein